MPDQDAVPPGHLRNRRRPMSAEPYFSPSRAARDDLAHRRHVADRTRHWTRAHVDAAIARAAGDPPIYQQTEQARRGGGDTRA